VAVDDTIARIAAELRARYGIRTADAVQLSAALSARATAFITNDARLRRVAELDVVILADYAS
jgi:predicted nucleic acid-binding protein